MRQMKSAVIVVACIAAAFSACAQSTAEAPTWLKEPEAFLGIKVGEPENIQPCPTKLVGGRVPLVDYAALPSLQGVCKDTTMASGGIFLWNLPELGFPYVVRVHAKDGVVARIVLTLAHQNYQRMYAALTERYGEPTVVERKTVKTTVGAEFASTEAVWRGKRLSMMAWERAGKIDSSMIVLGSIDAMRQELEEDKAKSSQGIQKF
jgi:hypothetical protein